MDINLPISKKIAWKLFFFVYISYISFAKKIHSYNVAILGDIAEATPTKESLLPPKCWLTRTKKETKKLMYYYYVLFEAAKSNSI